MLALINTNTMQPPIAPVGLDYIAGAVKRAGYEVEIIDLCLSGDSPAQAAERLAEIRPELVAMSFRNVDDCFWPSAQWFMPQLCNLIKEIRIRTDAPIVLGGVGFSIMPERIVEYSGADFGISGDGERSVAELLEYVRGHQQREKVPGLIWREEGGIQSNSPARPEPLSLPAERNSIDNKTYFEKGGQCGLETKRGCDRPCIYCADPLAKGNRLRVRDPAEVVAEAENLFKQGVDVLHLCDSEFNIPIEHAKDVCREFIRNGLGKKIRWYTYMAVTPFDSELAELMKKAGCAGIDFTADSACNVMLGTYRDFHRKEDLARAVRLCRENDIAVMLDLLLGGPGETRQTLAETIDFVKQAGPDCVGAGLGVRIYPDTEMASIVQSEGPLEKNPNIRRKYEGRVDFFRPTFYISHLLGPAPARLVHDLIADDQRFFKPMLEVNDSEATDHNYNDNTQLCEAIAAGARGAYWDILRKMRNRL